MFYLFNITIKISTQEASNCIAAVLLFYGATFPIKRLEVIFFLYSMILPFLSFLFMSSDFCFSSKSVIFTALVRKEGSKLVGAFPENCEVISKLVSLVPPHHPKLEPFICPMFLSFHYSDMCKYVFFKNPQKCWVSIILDATNPLKANWLLFIRQIVNLGTFKLPSQKGPYGSTSPVPVKEAHWGIELLTSGATARNLCHWAIPLWASGKYV